MLRKKMIGVFVLAMMISPVRTLAADNLQATKQPEILSLEQCLIMAFQNNKGIQEKEKQVAIAEEAVKEAKAGFWPTLNYQAAREESDVTKFQIGKAYEDHQFAAGISATLPLYTGGMLRNNLKLAKIQLEIAKEDLRKAKQQLTYDVKQAYYNVWLAEKVVQVQEASYHNLDQHVNRVRIRYNAETASKFDLMRAQVQRDTLKPKVISAQNQLVLAKLQLATLIGYPKDRAYQVQSDALNLKIPDSAGITLTEILNAVEQDRPELRQIQRKMEINQIVTAMEKAGYKPNAGLSLAYGGVNKDVTFEDWYDAWTLTLSVGGKLYDGKINARIGQAKENLSLTEIQEANLRDLIRLEAEQSLQNLAVSIENIRANQASIDLAKEALRMTEIRFDNGMATTMDIMDAQLALDQALTGYYQGIVSYLTAVAKLDLVMGRD
ncbi:MAG: TolC family protein [Firmicutes bacterium]|nr:TolC family protein [Bacillota bacterium]